MKWWVGGILVLFFSFLGLLFGYSVIIGGGLTAATAMGALFAFRPDVGIFAALFTIPLDAMGKITPEGAITVAKVVILLTLVTWLARALVVKDSGLVKVITDNPVMVLALFYLVFSFTSVVNATAKDVWFGQLTRRINLFLLMMLIINIISGKKVFKRAVMVLFLRTSLLPHLQVSLSS